MRLPEPTTEAGRAGLSALLAEPARAVIGLDFDGTLAPIVPRPEDARALPAALAALQRVAAVTGAVVVVTGRPAAQAVELGGLDGLGIDRLVVLGQYGFERWESATGGVTAPPVPPGVALVRDRLPRLLAEVGAPKGTRIEDKHAALVVHVRGTADPDDALARLGPALHELAAEADLDVQPGRLVLELRPHGMDKGTALRGFVEERAARSVLFAGDDLGDLPAYDAVEAMRHAGVPGLTVCSGSDEAPEVAARADLVVGGPEGMAALLDALAAALGSGS